MSVNDRIYSRSRGYGAIIAAALLALLILIMMKWDPAHLLLRKIHPISRYVFLISTLVVGLSIYSTWHNIRFRRLTLTYSGFLGKHESLIALNVIIFLSILSLMVSWTGVDVKYSTIGGLLPWSDANAYFVGAEHLLHEGRLDEWNQRRPLNATFFAARMAITGFDFLCAMILQAVLFGVSAFFAIETAARTLGRSVATIMFSLIYSFAAIYLPSTLSESLGLILGLLAFSLLWAGVSELSLSLYNAGIWLLTLALLARAGAMLVLPAFVLFAGYYFRGNRRIGIFPMLTTALAIVLGVLINKMLLFMYGNGHGAALSNFSLTLYGLASGGKGWPQIYSDYPQVRTMTEATASGFIYEKAINLVISEPRLILSALIKNLFASPKHFGEHLIMIVIEQNDGSSIYNKRNVMIGMRILLTLFILGGSRFFIKAVFDERHKKFLKFLLFFVSGFFLSLPFFYEDGGIRLIAATFPFIAVILAMSVLGWRKNPLKLDCSDSAPNRSTVIKWLPAITGVVIVFAAIVFPTMGHARLENKPISILRQCTNNELELMIRIGPETPFLNILDNDNRPSFMPRLRKMDFVIAQSNEQAKEWRTIPLPATLLLGYDIVSKQNRYIVGPLGFVEQNQGYHGICARNIGNKNYPIWKVESHY